MAKRTLTQHRASWTDKDVATLTKTALTAPARLIADALGRTASAIRRKAGLLGLSLRGAKRPAKAGSSKRVTSKPPSKKR